MTSPIIQLDAFELVASLVSCKGERGTEASVMFFDDVTRLVGPIPNRLVYDVMQRGERTEEYQLPRNYDGSILRNAAISKGVVEIGNERIAERMDELDSNLLNILIDTLSSDIQVVHNVTLLAQLSGATIGTNLPNQMYPVTTYSASIVMTEDIGFVVAVADLETLRFDFQMFSPENLNYIVTALAERAASTSPEGSDRSLIYTVGIPSKNYIHAALFADEENQWRSAFSSPQDDIDYQSLDDGQDSGVLFAKNQTDLASAKEKASEMNPLNLSEGIDSLATLSAVYLLRADRAAE